MKAIFSNDVRRRDPTFTENFSQAYWIVDPIPWIKTFVQVRPYIFNRTPECVIRRLAEIRSPCSHSQFAAWSNATPEFAYSLCHVGHEENSEHAHDGVKIRHGKRSESISPISNSTLLRPR